jgi:hypothetical protein
MKKEPEILASLLSLSVLIGARSYREGLQPEHLTKMRGQLIIDRLSVKTYRNGWKRLVKVAFTWGYRSAESEDREARMDRTGKK